MEEKAVMMGYTKSRCTQPFNIEFFSNSSACFFVFSLKFNAELTRFMIS